MDDYAKRYPWVNRRVNVLYLLLGAVDYAIDDLNEQLMINKLELFHNDKVLLKNIISTSKSLQNGIHKLQENSVYQSQTMGEEDKAVYEDSAYRLYSIILAIIDRAGNDDLSDLRLYSLTKFILGFKSLLEMPKLNFIFKSAFTEISQNISNGKYSIEDLKNLLAKENEK